MEQIYNDFINYNFESSNEYKDFKEIFPRESSESLLNYRKRFYKKINPRFDINFSPNLNNANNNNDQNRDSNNNNQNRDNNNNQNRDNNNTSITTPPLLEIIDLMAISISIPIYCLSLKNYVLLLITYYGYRLCISAGFPKISIEYLKLIIHNRNLGYLTLCAIIYITKTLNPFIAIPFTLCNLLYLVMGLNKYYKCELFTSIVSKRIQIMTISYYFEIGNILIIIIGIFLKLNKFYLIIIYIQYLKYRYYASTKFRECIDKISSAIETIRSNPNNPLISSIGTIIQKITNLFSGTGGGATITFANGGLMICNIF